MKNCPNCGKFLNKIKTRSGIWYNCGTCYKEYPGRTIDEYDDKREEDQDS